MTKSRSTSDMVRSSGYPIYKAKTSSVWSPSTAEKKSSSNLSKSKSRSKTCLRSGPSSPISSPKATISSMMNKYALEIYSLDTIWASPKTISWSTTKGSTKFSWKKTEETTPSFYSNPSKKKKSNKSAKFHICPSSTAKAIYIWGAAKKKSARSASN